jgi:hypothetical protein
VPPSIFVTSGLVPAMALLPPSLDSYDARRFLLAVAVQETDLVNRLQIGDDGRPITGHGRGWFQFERSGIASLLSHEALTFLPKLLKPLGYPPSLDVLHEAVAHNDVLACLLARLLLFTDPHPVPDDKETGWETYLRLWRPGHPRPEKWPSSWGRADGAITPGVADGRQADIRA